MADTPHLIAHRGLLRHAPENTLPAFAACVELGIGFELDVRTTKDGQLVVLHDDSVARTTDGGERSIRDLTLAEAKQLDAGGWFHPAFADVRIPTLEEVLAMVRKQNRGATIIALNIKQITAEGESQLVNLVAKYDLLDESFAFDQDGAVSRRLKKLNSRFRIGQNVNRDAVKRRLDEGLLDVFLLTFAATKREARLLQDKGKQVLFNYAGTGPARRDKAIWQRVLSAELDGMLTDYPLSCRSVWRATLANKPPLTRIHFGSCIKQDRPIPILRTILSKRPELFLFLGDNIYADTTDMDVMRRKYAKLQANVEFQKLMASCPVMATWDDHDYGVNDGGADYAQREASQRVFLDFWKEPANSPRRKRAGVYDARILGPPDKRVQIILLDTRYFRSTLKKGEKRVGGPYAPSDDPVKTMLGEDQWNWLEQQLRMPAEVRIVVSSIQCVSESAGQETWSNLPRERLRLFRMIERTKANGVLIVSGDRHWSELSVERRESPYPIFDLTSSSFNQLHARGTPTVNRNRLLPQTYHKENFGEIAIDWSGADAKIDLRILDLQGETQLSHTVRLSQLRPKAKE